MPARAPLRLTALALLVTLSHAAPALAAWPHDPYSNTGSVAACTAGGSQFRPASAPDGSGGVILVWYDGRTSTAYDIYAQRISAAGIPLWTANGVAVCTATGTQNYPAVLGDGAGGAIIAWQDFRGTSFDAYAQRLNANGVPQWTADGVLLSGATADQYSLVLASDGAGGAIAAWSDTRSGTLDVYARRITSAGVPQWAADGVAIASGAGTQYAPAMVSDGSGGVLLAWADNRSGTYDIYAQRVSGAGAAQWTANGVAVCTSAGIQAGPSVASDGAGSLLVAWEDLRSGIDYDVYVQRLTSGGFATWASQGLAVSTATDDQTVPEMASDGSGGAILAWSDYRNGNNDIYAQRVTSGGTLLWTANGAAVCTATGSQASPVVEADGAGGAIVVWNDARSGSSDAYGQRLSGLGVALWAAGGIPILAETEDQLFATLVSDGAGGAIVASQDYRAYSSTDIYAQRVERYGQLGNPEAVITGVKDVKNDQGGFVKVSWTASWLDADPTFGVFDYRLWRSVPATLVRQQALARAFTTDPDAAAAGGGFLVDPAAAQDYAWELAGSQGAAALSSYSFVAATTADSVPGSFPKTAFMVEARSSSSVAGDHWYSAPDSGYSVDNLAPVAPAPFTGQYAGGTTALHWNRNLEADLAGYRLYRGGTVAFTPSPASLVADLPDTGYVDPAGAPYVYKLTAVDAHGNESPVATLVPEGALGVEGGSVPLSLAFAAPAPNPARDLATLRFVLPRDGAVQLAVFDPAGRLVRTVAEGGFAAGEHAVAWDLRDGGGRAVGAGLYFARLETAGQRLVRRVVVAR